MSELLASYLTFIAPVIAAAMSTSGFDLFAKYTEITASWPAWAKQLGVATLAFALFHIGAVLGVTVGLDASSLPIMDYGEWIAAGLAYLFKQGKETKALKATMQPTPEFDPGA